MVVMESDEMKRLLKIEKYRCRDCGEEFTEFKFAQTHCMVHNHWCDAIPKFPLEYEDD